MTSELINMQFISLIRVMSVQLHTIIIDLDMKIENRRHARNH